MGSSVSDLLSFSWLFRATGGLDLLLLLNKKWAINANATVVYFYECEFFALAIMMFVGKSGLKFRC